MEKYCIKKLHSGGGVIVTYQCSAACMHCSYASSPKRCGDYMTKIQADNIFKTLRKMGCYSIHIGGGEPFMNFEKLLDVCIAARENNVGIDYIETNASWVTTEERTCGFLNKLLAADVSCLLISLDPFHNEFVPYEKVRNLAKWCRKTGMQTFIWQSQFEKVVAQFDASSTHALSEYSEKYGDEFTLALMNSYGIGINGRALKLADIVYEKNPAEYYLNQSGSCNIMSAHHFHVDMNENFIPPGCIGFQANLNDLQDLPEDKYANFLAVAKGGLKLLYERAVSTGFVPKKEGYSHKCGVCFDVKKYILNAANPVDIGPSDFFDEY